jgi:hypothetical protein
MRKAAATPFLQLRLVQRTRIALSSNGGLRSTATLPSRRIDSSTEFPLSDIELSERLYRTLIGKRYAPFTIQIDAVRVRKYAELIGDASEIRLDSRAARAAGFRDITAPPTFGFTIALLAGQAELPLADLGVTMDRTLHGEQRFDYFTPLCAGDVVTGCQWIEDLQEKKGGTLLMLTTKFELKNQFDELALTMVQTSIVPLDRGASRVPGT